MSEAEITSDTDSVHVRAKEDLPDRDIAIEGLKEISRNHPFVQVRVMTANAIKLLEADR